MSSTTTTQHIEMDGLIIAGTPTAQDSEFADGAVCVICGARIRNVVLTNVGPMGCDCYATKTGDATMRRAFSTAVRNIERDAVDVLDVNVRASNRGGFAVLAKVDDAGWTRFVSACRVATETSALALAAALRERFIG